MAFEDPEAVVISYLNGALVAAADPARASTRVPTTRPASLVRVMLTGMVRRSTSHRDAQVTVECWATDGVAAARLADKVYDWLADLDVGSSHVPQGPDGWVGGPYSQPDPDSGTPRYVMTVILRQREV